MELDLKVKQVVDVDCIQWLEKDSNEELNSVVVEKALQIIVNGKNYSVTMQTPGAEGYLTCGLLYSEGQDNFDSFNISIKKNEKVTKAYVDIEKEREQGTKRRLTSTSSCGLCGIENADDLLSEHEPMKDDTVFNINILNDYYEKISKEQIVFQATGGCHAASAIDENGELLCVFEDIGRHNAVDKVIGFLLLNKKLHLAKILTVSGRVSYEIVQKCYRAKIPVLTAISAPSSLAVEIAKKVNMTLVAFCRENRATIYSGNSRVAGLHSSGCLS
jgi:FdhD protein